ncbi:MAG: threonine-phosphate decarboxylase CobD [Halofilum sp. (in: g-proteobacteria)]|nr:threonine-phosphate decarboxylase CobD [Halofilum sp. (in: g-proteobacteria)]
MLEHGGNLAEMVRALGRPEGEWLDLSTGVNPHPWDAPTPPPACWSRLPDSGDGLLEAAGAYYGCESLLATPGSQAALALLPLLRAPSRVAVIDPGYTEHAAAWKRAGHEVVPISSAQLATGVGTAFDVLVVINPNNPDGTYFEPETLLEWRTALAARGGWLVIDEAFVDPTPGYSLATRCPAPGLVVLRSIGKFFGLPGMRVGFALGAEDLLARMEEALGPWPVNGPGRWVARQALLDTDWHERTRATLAAEGDRLRGLLADLFGRRVVGTPLFATVLSPRAAAIHERLAEAGILARLLDRQDGIRFGLPPDEPGWQRLEETLRAILSEHAGA